MAEIRSFSQLGGQGYWDVDGMGAEELARSFAVLNERMSVVYKFVLAYNDYINRGHSYSSEDSLTMMEAHILTDICDFPNSTVTSLANAWGRSVSSTSQTVRRLLAKDLVTRENAPDNGKVFYLHPTEKGQRLSDRHKRYDVEDTIKTVKSLMHGLSFDEVETMLKALDRFTELLHKKSK